MAQKDILDEIKARYPYMSKSHKKIADYCLEHYQEAAFLTAGKLGKKLQLSEATVVRFALSVGLEGGYPAFQNALSMCIKERIESGNTLAKTREYTLVQQQLKALEENVMLLERELKETRAALDLCLAQKEKITQNIRALEQAWYLD